MKKEDLSKLSAEQLAELTALSAMPESEIDTSDAPEVADWTGARRGLFYNDPAGQQIIRVDADVAEWFQVHGSGKDSSQSRINQALRQYVVEQMRKAG
jgi:uncharacterized protein (DUF4415 family)